MRVLWVFDRLVPAWLQVAERLARVPDISLEIMARYDTPPQLASDIQITPLTCRSKLDFQARKQIREKLRDGNFDVAHAYTSRNLASLVGACRGLRNTPKIVGYRGAISRLRRLDPSNWITFWHPTVDQIMCVSRATEQALRASRIPSSKLVAVNEGCDTSGLRQVDPSEVAEFNIPTGAFVVGTVANMRPVKGIDILLRAALQLTDLPNMYWLLVGGVSDPRISELAADPRISDRVQLAGPREYGRRYAELFDVFAAPSRMEGFGIAVLEAMVQRVCPVVSDVGGLTELIRHEQDGLIVPSEDPTALAKAIRRLYHDHDLRRRLADSAHRRSSTEFSIAAWTGRVERVYRELIDASKGSAAA